MQASRRVAAALKTAGAVLLLVSLFAPWFRHVGLHDGLRTTQTYGLVAAQFCAALEPAPLTCRNEFLATGANHGLYPVWVDAGLVTFVAALATSALLFFAAVLATRPDSTSRRWRPEALALRLALLAVVAAVVFVVRRPSVSADARLGLEGGIVGLVLGAAIGIAGVIVRVVDRAATRSSDAPPDWIAASLAFASCTLVLASVLTTSWRIDNAAREFGTFDMRECLHAGTALRCMRAEYGTIVAIQATRELFARYGRWTFNAGIGATCVMLVVVASATAGRSARERRIAAVAAVAGCAVLLAYATRFITADAGAAGTGLGIGYPIAVAGAAIGIAAGLRLLWSPQTADASTARASSAPPST